MTTQGTSTPQAIGTDLPFLKRISRRTAVVQLVGLALAGGSLTELATSCGSPSQSPTPIVRSVGTVLYIYRGHSSPVFAMAWSPDGKRIASGGQDNTVQVWDAMNGSHVYIYRAQHNSVNSLAWSPDGKRIASASFTEVHVWDAATGSLMFTYRGHSDNVLTVAWSPDGHNIVSGGVDATVQVWNATTGDHLVTYRKHTG